MIVKKRNEFMADRGKKVMYAHIYGTHPRNGPFNWLPFHKNGAKTECVQGANSLRIRVCNQYLFH